MMWGEGCAVPELSLPNAKRGRKVRNKNKNCIRFRRVVYKDPSMGISDRSLDLTFFPEAQFGSETLPVSTGVGGNISCGKCKVRDLYNKKMKLLVSSWSGFSYVSKLWPSGPQRVNELFRRLAWPGNEIVNKSGEAASCHKSSRGSPALDTEKKVSSPCDVVGWEGSILRAWLGSSLVEPRDSWFCNTSLDLDYLTATVVVIVAWSVPTTPSGYLLSALVGELSDDF